MEITDIEYQKGDFSLSQGAPGNQAGRIKKTGDSIKINRGSGWYEEKTPSKLFVKVRDGKKIESLEIAHEFHESIGKITQKRLEKIDQLKGRKIEKKDDIPIVETIVDEMVKIIK